MGTNAVLQMKLSLRSRPQDMRVTNPIALGLTTPNIVGSFAAGLRGRFARHIRFLSSDLILRRAFANVRLQTLFRQVKLSVAPRFQLTSQAEKRFRIVEWTIEIPMFLRAGTRLAAASDGLRTARLRAVDRTEGLKRPEETTLTIACPPVDIANQRAKADLLVVPRQRRTPAFFAPVKMVALEPRRSFPLSDGLERRFESKPIRSETWAADEQQRTASVKDAIHMKQLTNQVVEALERRLIAGRERLARR